MGKEKGSQLCIPRSGFLQGARGRVERYRNRTNQREARTIFTPVLPNKKQFPPDNIAAGKIDSFFTLSHDSVHPSNLCKLPMRIPKRDGTLVLNPLPIFSESACRDGQKIPSREINRLIQRVVSSLFYEKEKKEKGRKIVVESPGLETRKFCSGENDEARIRIRLQIDFLLALDHQGWARRLKWARRNPNFLLALSLPLSLFPHPSPFSSRPPSPPFPPLRPVTRLNQPDPRASLVHTLIRDSAEQLIKFIRIALDYAARSSLS